jgi:hypothetical protein
LTYTHNKCTEIIVDRIGHELSKQSSPHRIVETHKDYIVVDQPNNGGPGKVFFEGSSFYVEVKVGNYI